MNVRGCAAAALVVSALLGDPAFAFDPRAQVEESDLIVAGRVVAVEARRDPRGEEIVDAEIAVDEAWKGFPGAAPIRVLAPGGALANPGLALEGNARFREGERVLLFLTRAGDAYRLWGTVFGKYAIDGEGMDARVAGDLPPIAPVTDLAWVSLDEIRFEVDEVLAGGGADDPMNVALRVKD